jgi:hypothetical protein
MKRRRRQKGDAMTNAPHKGDGQRLAAGTEGAVARLLRCAGAVAGFAAGGPAGAALGAALATMAGNRVAEEGQRLWGNLKTIGFWRAREASDGQHRSTADDGRPLQDI